MAVPPEGGRRQLAARGVLINSAFTVGIGGLNFVRALVVAAFMTTAEYGVWAAIFLAVAFAISLKIAAVSDKYIQQDDEDQVLAFQKAFTLELLSAGALIVLMCAYVPLLALVYGQSELLAPGFAMILFIPGLALQMPALVFYRRMDFFRQRMLTSVDPLVGFVVSVALAIGGLGYWGLVIGTVVGSWCGGAVATAWAPYPIRLHFDRATAREYISFSWPLLVGAGGGVIVAQAMLLSGDLALGLAGAGAIGLASAITQYTDRVDAVVTQALYPAVCRVRDRADILFEAFIKSNRLTLMWGVPFGIGLTLFASDLIEFGLGEEWESSLVLLQVFGTVAAINHIGFNWTAFYRAIGNTRPIAVVTVAALVVLAGTAIPLLFAWGLDGFAAGTAAAGAVALLGRWYYVAKLFPQVSVTRHTIRAIAPTIPAVAIVLLVRLVAPDERSAGMALGELALYIAVTAAATFVLERRLLREAVSYVRRRPAGGLEALASP